MDNIKELRQYSLNLYKSLLKKHIKSTNLKPSIEEEYCVKAFCVLAHAALEDYFESLTLKTMKNAKSKYESNIFVKTIPTSQHELDEINEMILQLLKSLILSTCFTIFSKNESETLKKHKSKLISASDNLRKGSILSEADVQNFTKKSESYTKDLLKETHEFFRNYVSDNHGASLHYILKLLIPVGIDIPDNLKINSIQNIAKYRGSYAHTLGNIDHIISAHDLAVYLIDAVRLCEIVENSISKFNNYAEN